MPIVAWFDMSHLPNTAGQPGRTVTGNMRTRKDRSTATTSEAARPAITLPLCSDLTMLSRRRLSNAPALRAVRATLAATGRALLADAPRRLPRPVIAAALPVVLARRDFSRILRRGVPPPGVAPLHGRRIGNPAPRRDCRSDLRMRPRQMAA